MSIYLIISCPDSAVAGDAALTVPAPLGQDLGPLLPGGRATELGDPHQGGGHAHGPGGLSPQGEVENQSQAEEVRERRVDSL